MSTQFSSSVRSATSSDEGRRRGRPHSKDAFLGFSKFALKFFKLSNFTCKAGTAADDDEADARKKPDAARRKWRFLKPGSAASQTGGSGELARHKNHIESELVKKKPRHGEEANADDKKSKETLLDMLLNEKEDGAAITKNNVVGSDKTTSCILSQFLTSDDEPVELQKEASNYVTGNANKHGAGWKEKRGEEEEEESHYTDMVMVSTGSKSIKEQGRNPRVTYHTRRLLRELVRRVPADNPVSIYANKMVCAVGSARDLFRPALFRVKLKKELVVFLAESQASFVTSKMKKALKYDGGGAPTTEELWKKEIRMGRRCKPLELAASSRWSSNAEEVPAICLAEERTYSVTELLEFADEL